MDIIKGSLKGSNQPSSKLMDSSESKKGQIPACKRYIDELIEEEEKQPGNLQDI